MACSLFADTDNLQFDLVDAPSRGEHEKTAKEWFESTFVGKTVSEIKEQDTSEELPTYRDTISPPYKSTKHSFLRGFTLLHMANDSPITLKKISAAPPKKTVCLPEREAIIRQFNSDINQAKVDIFYKDKQLAQFIPKIPNILSTPVSSLTDEWKLFNFNTPIPEDICQNDLRSTCYLLASLASYAASPITKGLLKNCFIAADNEHTAVILYCSLLDRNITVLTTNTRLVNSKGQDIYSFGNGSNARWAGIMERAVHAAQIHRFSGCKQIISNIPIEQADLRGEIREHQNMALGKGNTSPQKLLDYSSTHVSMSFLPSVSFLTKVQGEGFTSHELIKPENLQLIRFNVEHGIPVILGTKGGSAGAFNALTNGSPTNHAVGVLGPAQRDGETGLLIYDPYGESLGLETGENSFSSMQKKLYDSDEPTIQLPPIKATSAVRFYAYSDLHKYFSEVKTARGGYNRLPKQQETSF